VDDNRDESETFRAACLFQTAAIASMRIILKRASGKQRHSKKNNVSKTTKC